MPETYREDINPDTGEVVSHIDGWWEVVTKDKDGEPVKTTARKHSTKTRPGMTPEKLEEMLIRDAAPTIVKPTKRRKPTRSDTATLIIPDMQIGYRGEETFHDERAMELAQVAIREQMPDRVLFIGDNLDLPPFSKYEQRPDWQQTTQRSIDRFHTMLAQTRANAPDARITVLEGNHEARLEKSVRNNMAELSGLARAHESLGVLTLRSLLKVDELEVEYVSGYPRGVHWLEDHLKAIHGTKVRSGGSTAAAVVNKEVTSTIFGHVHRVEEQWRTIEGRRGKDQKIFATTFGTLARVDGGVPGGSYTTDEHGDTILRTENWQQAVGLVMHNERHAKPYTLHINEDGIDIFGKVYGE